MTDPRVDSYIKNAPEFARPILQAIRKTVRKNCPEAEETLKWGFPHFLYNGKILCGFGAFKAHCTLGFWRGREIEGLNGAPAKVAMGQMGRITSLKDLPNARDFASYIRQAA